MRLMNVENEDLELTGLQAPKTKGTMKREYTGPTLPPSL